MTKSIAATVIGAVLIAIILSVGTDAVDRACKPLHMCKSKDKITLDPRAFGSWSFLRFEPDVPTQSFPGVDAVPVSLLLLENEKYASTAALNLGNGASTNMQSSGSFEALSPTTIQLNSSSEQGGIVGVHDIAFEGDSIMKLTDRATGITLVFQRR
jgi:hypothetical protein